MVDPRRRRARLDAALAELESEQAARQGAATGRAAGEGEVERAEARLERARGRALARRAAVDVRARTAGRRFAGPRVHPEGCRVAAAEEHLEKVKARAAKRAEAAAETGSAPQVNVTDPHSRIMKTSGRWLQGYNPQAAVNAEGVIIAAEVSQDTNDMRQCVPMMAATQANLDAAGVEEAIGTMLFDAGYCSDANITAPGPDRLIATAKSWKMRRETTHNSYLDGDAAPGASHRQAMEHRLRSKEGAELYAMRQHTVEPVFGQIKHNRRYDRFMRRGRGSADAEWKLMATAHNIIKLFTKQTTPIPAAS
jgi:hypothetical protein